MSVWEIILWSSVLIIFYSYLGYGIVLWLLLKLKNLFNPSKKDFYSRQELPEVTFLIAAYNEEDFIEEKIENTLALDYDPEKLKILIITDGSSDKTPQLVAKYPQVKLMHEDTRRGKIAAVHRAMPEVKTDVVIYSDANTILNNEAAYHLVRHFKNEKIGAVAGEKRIISQKEDTASGAGEGIYWKYESTLKKWDSQFNTVVGAAGELFAIRTSLYENIPADTVIEDFYMTLRIAQKGYKVAYEPGASAMEGPSASVKEEMKRKVRIAAGGLQAISRLMPLLNPFRYGWLTFQYVSHRVLRWTLAPLALLMALISNALLAFSGYYIYQILFYLQISFYLLSLVGYVLQHKKIKIKIFFIPYYFFIMNLSVYLGFGRFIKKSQPVTWERAKRG